MGLLDREFCSSSGIELKALILPSSLRTTNLPLQHPAKTLEKNTIMPSQPPDQDLNLLLLVPQSQPDFKTQRRLIFFFLVTSRVSASDTAFLLLPSSRTGPDIGSCKAYSRG